MFLSACVFVSHPISELSLGRKAADNYFSPWGAKLGLIFSSRSHCHILLQLKARCLSCQRFLRLDGMSCFSNMFWTNNASTGGWRWSIMTIMVFIEWENDGRKSLNINEQSVHKYIKTYIKDTELTLVQQTKVIFFIFHQRYLFGRIFIVIHRLRRPTCLCNESITFKETTKNDSKPAGVASPFHQPTHTCQASNSVQSWEHKINRSNYSTAQSRCLREPTAWLWVITGTLMRYRSIGMWVCCGD